MLLLKDIGIVGDLQPADLLAGSPHVVLFAFLGTSRRGGGGASNTGKYHLGRFPPLFFDFSLYSSIST